MCLDELFIGGFAPRGIDDEARDKSAQIEPAIEPIAEGSEAGLGALAVPWIREPAEAGF